VFLGRDYSQGNRDYSENIASVIDSEIRALIDEGFERCEAILTEHRDKLERCAQYLIRHEKIDGPDFYKLMDGEIDIDGNPVGNAAPDEAVEASEEVNATEENIVPEANEDEADGSSEE